MNVYIDNCDVGKLNSNMLNMMDYLQSYLDNDWTIKKRNSCYVLTKNNDKMLISDSIHISNSPCIVSDNEVCDDSQNKKSLHILGFLYHVLNNKWTIKKSLKNEYIFIRKHEGRKEFFTEKYLHTFLKENFNSTLIK